MKSYCSHLFVFLGFALGFNAYAASLSKEENCETKISQPKISKEHITFEIVATCDLVVDKLSIFGQIDTLQGTTISKGEKDWHATKECKLEITISNTSNVMKQNYQ